MARLSMEIRVGSASNRGVTASVVVLSDTSVSEGAFVGDVVAALSVYNPSGAYTFSIIADPDNKFSISGADLLVATAFNYEAAASHSVTIEADNGVDDPISRQFIISVVDSFDTSLVFSDARNSQYLGQVI